MFNLMPMVQVLVVVLKILEITEIFLGEFLSAEKYMQLFILLMISQNHFLVIMVPNTLFLLMVRELI